MEECHDKRIWSLEASGAFSVKSLVTHLSLASPLDKHLEKALWRSKCPRRANITVWTMLFGYLNCSSVMQRKLPSCCLSPYICTLCMADKEDLQHLFFDCSYAGNCWQRLFACFNLRWAFGNVFRDNIL